MGVEDDCVCSTPKIFVGQIPTDVDRESLSSVFAPYGRVNRIDLLTPRQPNLNNTRSAMIWFESWTEVERVMEAFEADAVHLTGSKKLVVRIADPPKRGENSIGIKPRKLFIGQIPRDVQDAHVKDLFASYGVIEEFEVPKRMTAVSCAFVRFQKWSEAENAIRALNEKYKFPESKRALVVKFADAKTVEKEANRSTQLIGEKRPLSPDDRYDHSKRHVTSFHDHRRPLDPLDLGYVASRMGLPMGLGTLTGMGRVDWVREESHRFLRGINGDLTMVSDLAASTRSNDGISYQSINAVYMHPEPIESTERLMEDQITNDQESQSIMNQPSHRLPPKPLLGSNGKLGRGFTDPRVKKWTLFVGQIPHQADEYALWELFSAFGEILELNVLRKDGKHRDADDSINSKDFYQKFDSLLNESEYNVVVGQRVEGKIVNLDDTGVFIDYGGKDIGFCASADLTLQSVSKPSELFQLNSVHSFEVVAVGLQTRFQGREYFTALSRQNIIREMLFKRLHLMHELQVKLTVGVLEKNRGGYVVVDRYGFEGFIPGRHAATNPSLTGMENDPLIGKEIEVKLLDVQEEEQNVIFSQRKVINKAITETQFAPGSVLEGMVESVMPYGVFINVHGLAGLLHNTQISHAPIADTSVLFKVKDRVKVLVMSYDGLRGRLSLSTKKLEPNPGDMVNNRKLVYEQAEEMGKKFRSELEATNQRAQDMQLVNIGPDVTVR
eukprot:g1986.t1